LGPTGGAVLIGEKRGGKARPIWVVKMTQRGRLLFARTGRLFRYQRKTRRVGRYKVEKREVGNRKKGGLCENNKKVQLRPL